MAVYEPDVNLFLKIDDIFPATEIDISRTIYTDISSLTELYNFLKSINFEFEDFSLSYSTKWLSNRVKVPIKRDGRTRKNSTLKATVYTPDGVVIKYLFDRIQSIYLDKWKRLKTALEEEYGIIKPYDMRTVEHEDNKLVTSSDGTQTHAYTNTDNVIGDDENSEDRIYGFNSTENGGVKSDSSTTNRQIKSNGSDSGTKTNKLDYNSDRDVDRTVTRQGNTGNITSQEMIERELKLREFLLYEVIYKDLNEYFTLMVY